MILRLHITYTLLTVFLFLGCSEKKKNTDKSIPDVYTCPMHPEIIRNEPGQCPICGMDLVQKVRDGEKSNEKDLQMLLQPTDKYVLSSIASIKPQEKQLTLKPLLFGVISYNTQQVNVISSRVSGRIEKLYIKYSYQYIKKGQKLMEIYSPELETEQRNLIYLVKSEEDESIVRNIEKKLLLLGMTQEEIDQVKQSLIPLQTVSVFSSFNGHLHQGASQPESSMSDVPTSPNSLNQTVSPLKEGSYVNKGQTIFTLYRTDRLWAIINAYPEIANHFPIGSKVKLSIDGVKEDIIASVDFVEPSIRPDQKNVSIRVNLPNPKNEIKVGANVKATVLEIDSKGLYIPSSSVISLGIKSIVFVKHDSYFEAREITIGPETDNWVKIISGIKEDEMVAQNAQMLMDSESFIKAN